MSAPKILTADEFNRMLVCTVFGPPPEAVKKMRGYVEALRAEQDALRRELDLAQQRGSEWFRATAVLHDRANAAEAERDAALAALRGLIDVFVDRPYNNCDDVENECYDECHASWAEDRDEAVAAARAVLEATR